MEINRRILGGGAVIRKKANIKDDSTDSEIGKSHGRGDSKDRDGKGGVKSGAYSEHVSVSAARSACNPGYDGNTKVLATVHTDGSVGTDMYELSDGRHISSGNYHFPKGLSVNELAFDPEKGGRDLDMIIKIFNATQEVMGLNMKSKPSQKATRKQKTHVNNGQKEFQRTEEKSKSPVKA